MERFAVTPVDEVTVKDIAVAVDMTPAAVYYHFASKEQILLEGMQQFRDRLLDEVRSNLPDRGDGEGLARLIAHLVTWTAKQDPLATVYFVNSIGLNQPVEALRRETRVELVDLFRAAVKAARARTSRAEAAVSALALVSLLETSLASMLNRDAAYRGIGARKFAGEIATIGSRLAGLDPA